MRATTKNQLRSLRCPYARALAIGPYGMGMLSVASESKILPFYATLMRVSNIAND